MNSNKQDYWGAVRVMLVNYSTVSRSRKDQNIHLGHLRIGGGKTSFLSLSLRNNFNSVVW